MSQLSGFLKLEVAKYKDIDHILKKLEDDGEVQNVYEVFKGIFDNELQFTVGELMRIQEVKKEQIDIKRQCQNNLSLFKNNLLLIVEMIIEKALKNTLTENKVQQEITTTCLTEETMEPMSQPTSSQAVSTNIDLTQLPKNQQINQSGNKKSASKNKAKPNQREQPQTLNLSSETKFSTSNLHHKKLNLSQLSNSKFEASPISQILQSNNSPQCAKSFLKDKSMTQSHNYYTPRAGNQSCNSFRQIGGDSLNNSSSFVNSEFNYVRGSVKFSRSPRSRDNHDLSPGPGSYQTDRSSLRKTSPKIGKAMKVSWFDTVAQTESPGPYLYPSQHFLSK